MTSLLYTRGITPKRETSSGIHLSGLGPGKQFQRHVEVAATVGDPVSDLTRPGIELQTPRTDNDVLKN